MKSTLNYTKIGSKLAFYSDEINTADDFYKSSITTNVKFKKIGSISSPVKIKSTIKSFRDKLKNNGEGEMEINLINCQ